MACSTITVSPSANAPPRLPETSRKLPGTAGTARTFPPVACTTTNIAFSTKRRTEEKTAATMTTTTDVPTSLSRRAAGIKITERSGAIEAPFAPEGDKVLTQIVPYVPGMPHSLGMPPCQSSMEESYEWRVWTPYTVPMLKPKTVSKRYDNHNMPPSKVIHCRAVADGCKETDLVQVMRPFGNIRALTLMPKLRQALVEFKELESAIACVTFSQLQPILLLGRQMYVNYSKSTEINTDFSNSASFGQTPTNILFFTIINAMHPVNVETVKKICAPYAYLQRIVIFHKNGLQALVEFLTIEDAQRVQNALNGCDIFAGCCTLKIDFSKTGRLNVHANTAETYDIEIDKRIGGKVKHQHHQQHQQQQQQAISALLAGAVGFPTVQSIIANAMAGGPMNPHVQQLQQQLNHGFIACECSRCCR